MNINKLYEKERQYEKKVFGDYTDIRSLNLASFIIFLEQYLVKVKEAYAGKWQTQLPPWLLSCKEYREEGSAPVKAYEELIKIMTLAGAALEAYSDIDFEKWRENADKDATKWK